MKKFIVLTAVALVLSACASMDPYKPAPTTCEGIDAERVTIAKKLKIESQASALRKWGMMLVGAVVNPAAAVVAAPLVWNLDIDTTGERKRSDLLWIAGDRMGCK